MSGAEATDLDDETPGDDETPTISRVSYLHRALVDGHATIASDGAKGTQTITYSVEGRSERFSDPEEKVRAEFWAELVYRYGYSPDRIGVEVTVPDRTPRDAADLVVFTDDKRTRPFAVIECKAEGISDPEFEQAVEQAAGNGTWSKFRSAYIGVVAGLTRRFLDFSDEFGVLEREANIIADLPEGYGKPLPWKYVKGGSTDIAAVDRGSLISTIKKSHQTLWGGGRLSPPAAFGELCKLIFIKINDEQAPRRKGEPYEFQIRSGESSRDLATRLRALYRKHQERDPDVFTDTIRVDDQTLRNLVAHLEPINLSATDLDTKGVAFEQFMDSFFKGDFGQYFTPRPVIDLMVSLVDISADDLLIDPACGSGGFLLYAMDAVRRQADDYHEAGSHEHYRHWHRFAERNIFGIEINDEIARVAKMNMILHDDGHSNVVGADALQSFESLSAENPGLQPGAFDVVLTNPPFGAQIDARTKRYLGDYELGRKADGSTRTRQKSEVLFVERVIDLLKPGVGRAAVVLPDGLLSNSSLRYVRELVLERAALEAVISLPGHAFSHFGASVKSSVILLRRRADHEEPPPSEQTFMALVENIGYDAQGKETENELPALADEFLRSVRRK